MQTGYHDEVMCLDCGFTWNDYGGWSPKTWCRAKPGQEAGWSGNRDPDFALAPMSAEAAAWVRKHAWNGVIRAEHKRAPKEALLCACQVGPSPSCEAGNHAVCHRESPHASAETWVMTTRGHTAQFAEPFAHPTMTATGAQHTTAAQVWLADRTCRWRCPCSCHGTGKTGAEPVERVELVAVEERPAAVAEPDTLTAVVEKAGGRCQCERCPAHRRDQGGRCETEHGKVRLLAAPAYPGARPERERVVTDPQELRAWCPPCYEEAVKRARKTDRDMAYLALENQESLF